jgi:3-hydroxyisobutyrate dehydrogenase-like beta-hydroxyacid dehydrogenase
MTPNNDSKPLPLLGDQGIGVVSSAREAAEEAAVVVSMLRAKRHGEALSLGEG